MLLSIPLLFVLNAVELRKAKMRGMLFANFEAMKRVSRQLGQPKHVLWLVLRISVIMLLTFAIAGTTVWYTTDKGQVDFVIALDVSSSMSASDIEPTRIDAAKEAARDFIDQLKDNKIESNIALVSFSGVALVHKEFTFDHREAKDAVDSMYISDIPGTAVGNAIITSSNILAQREAIKSVILMTDGQSNVGIDVDRAIQYANQRSVVVNTIGIATKEGATFGNLTSISGLDEEMLIEIAEQTDGNYFYVTDRAEFSRAFRNLALAPEGRIGIKLAPYFLFAVIALVFMEWAFVITKYRVIP